MVQTVDCKVVQSRVQPGFFNKTVLMLLAILLTKRSYAVYIESSMGKVFFNDWKILGNQSIREIKIEVPVRKSCNWIFVTYFPGFFYLMDFIYPPDNS